MSLVRRKRIAASQAIISNVFVYMQPKLSIITATFNSGKIIPGLIGSLKSQTDLDFEWVIADGGSTDGTLNQIAEAASNLRVVVDSREDFGVYDALNRAIRRATGDYYLVLGADDTLCPEAIANFRSCVVSCGADIVTAKIKCAGKIVGVRRAWPWLYGQFAYVSAHAVGALIRRGLHDQLGFYSRHYPIAADQLFLKQAVRAGAQVLEADFVAGEFHEGGLSGSDILGALSEGFRVQVKTGENPVLQFFIFILRVLKNWRRIKG